MFNIFGGSRGKSKKVDEITLTLTDTKKYLITDTKKLIVVKGA